MTTSAVISAEPVHDDAITICAISVVAAIVGVMLHEGIGHAALALLTGTQTGVLSAVAWSSARDSRLVAAGGTLVNLAAGLIFWLGMQRAHNASANTRLFLLLSCAFNLFTGTGYFFFSGVTNFGDWAVVIAGIQPYWLWRTLLIAAGMVLYYGAVLVVGVGIVRYLAIPAQDRKRLQTVTWLPYLCAIVVLTAGAALNPFSIQLVWQSALPSTAGANSGLLWLQYYIPRRATPQRPVRAINRSYAWIVVATACALVYIFVVGRGITLHR